MASLLLFPGGALAHELRTVAAGKYEVAAGWDVEPPIEGQKNGAQIYIWNAGTNHTEPVEGAEKTLRVRLAQQGQTQDLPLHTVFGQKGVYVADLVPTRAGDIEFDFTGAINGDLMNERFNSADRFGGVQSLVSLQFPPAADPARAADLAQQARADADAARALGAAGLGAGVLGVLVALAALAGRRRIPRISQVNTPSATPETA
jgi:hypothetical protein